MPQHGPRPHTWVTGTDPLRHEQYQAFLRAKAQANFRNEGWELTFPEWARAWDPYWHQRGRGPGQRIMSRKDWRLPWTTDNIMICDRSTWRKHQVQTIREKRAQQ